MNLSACLPHLGTAQFESSVEEQVNINSWELADALQPACQHGDPDIEEDFYVSVNSVKEQPDEIELDLTVDFTERQHTGCSNHPISHPGKATLVARIERKNGATHFEDARGRNLENY